MDNLSEFFYIHLLNLRQVLRKCNFVIYSSTTSCCITVLETISSSVFTKNTAFSDLEILTH